VGRAVTTVRKTTLAFLCLAILLVDEQGSSSFEKELDQRPRFVGSIRRVDESDVPFSWRPGCPTDVKDLRLLSITHWGFDGQVERGELIVASKQAKEVLSVMRRVFRHGYPFKRMKLVDRFDADDARSMKANNTSGFNCRYIAGTDTWSQHAFGLAIDINPVQNPYVQESGEVSPAKGARFADRSRKHPAMIHQGDEVTQAFAAIGWDWGGLWSGAKDYQHFSLTGG
jgi:hypothetical protein